MRPANEKRPGNAARRYGKVAQAWYETPSKVAKIPYAKILCIAGVRGERGSKWHFREKIVIVFSTLTSKKCQKLPTQNGSAHKIKKIIRKIFGKSTANDVRFFYNVCKIISNKLVESSSSQEKSFLN